MLATVLSSIVDYGIQKELQQMRDQDQRDRMGQGIRRLAWLQHGHFVDMLNATAPMRHYFAELEYQENKKKFDKIVQEQKDRMLQKLSDFEKRHFASFVDNQKDISQQIFDVKKIIDEYHQDGSKTYDERYFSRPYYHLVQPFYERICGRIILAGYARGEFNYYAEDAEHLQCLKAAIYAREETKIPKELIAATVKRIEATYPFVPIKVNKNERIPDDIVADLLVLSYSLGLERKACLRAYRSLYPTHFNEFNRRQIPEPVIARMKLNEVLDTREKVYNHDGMKRRFEKGVTLATEITQKVPDDRLQRRTLRMIAGPLFDLASNGDQMNTVTALTGVIPNEHQRDAILDRVLRDNNALFDHRVEEFKRGNITLRSMAP